MWVWRRCVGVAIAVSFGLASQAWAGEAIVYAPPAKWVKPIEPPKPDANPGGAIAYLLDDSQIYFGPDADETYSDMALEVLNATGLQAAGQVGATWDPAQQTLTIHRLEVIRNGKSIDVLSTGDKFLTLRRENNLSLAMLDGRLTANKQIEDLRVGDIVRFSYSIKGRDPALGSHSEDVMAWFGNVAVDRVYFRAVWPKSKPLHIKVGAALGKLEPHATSDGSELVFERTNFTPPKGPEDAPARYAIPARIEMSDYADWKSLSASVAPLYQRISTFKPDSALAAEVEKIKSAQKDDLHRAYAALRLVQEQVRYVYLDEGAGGYTPATPDQTWSRRFGDCKGKTALLMSLLRAMNINAVPVLVSSNGADGLDKNLPRMSAFDHVLVRAEIAGKFYWMDGTMIAERLEDLETAPNLEFGLPLSTSGAPLLALAATVPAQPLAETLLEVDASAGLYIDGPVKVQFIWRGESAMAMRMRAQETPRAQLEKAINDTVASSYNWITPDRAEVVDEPDGDFRATVYGKGKGSWAVDQTTRAATWYAASSAYVTEFDERKDGVDRDAPYSLTFPKRERWVTRVRLPRNATGFAVSGDDVDTTVAHIHLQRKAKIDGDWASVELEVTNLAPEVEVVEALAAKAQFKKLPTSEYVQIRAPRGLQMSQAETDSFVKTTDDKTLALLQRGYAKQQARDFKGAMADYDEAIANKPDDARGYRYRADLHGRLGQVDQAVADVDRALNLTPKDQQLYGAKAGYLRSVHREGQAIDALVEAEKVGVISPELLIQRAGLHWTMHDAKGAQADAAAAIKADPENGYMRAVAARYGLPLDMPAGEVARRMTETLEPILAKYPSAQAYAVQGAYFGQINRLADAVAAYDKAIELKPEAAYFFSRAQIKNLQGNKAGALSDLDRYVEAAPSRDSYWNRADFKRREKDFTGADADYAKAIAIDPDEPNLRINRIDLIRERGDEAASAKMFDDLVAANPTSFPIRLARARAFMVAKDYDKALAQLDAASALSPPDLNAKIQLNATYSRVHELAKHYDQAVKYLDLVVAQDTKNSVSYNQRCWLKATRDIQLESAIADCDAALALNPGNAAFLDSKALAELRLNRLDAALKDYDAAIEARPRQAGSLFARGLVRQKKGDAAGAKADMDAAMKIDPKVSDEFAGYGLKPGG